MSPDNTDLVQRCRAGDDRALHEFVACFQQSVLGLCFRILRHRQDAEDVAQEVFVRAFRHLDRYDSSRPLTPWLLTIAANRCRTFLSTRNRHPKPMAHLPGLLATPDASDSPALREELEYAVEALREDYRICFLLFYEQQLSCAEIATTLDCPEGTVKTRLFRARRDLIAHLRRRGIVSDTGYELRRF